MDSVLVLLFRGPVFESCSNKISWTAKRSLESRTPVTTFRQHKISILIQKVQFGRASRPVRLSWYCLAFLFRGPVFESEITILGSISAKRGLESPPPVTTFRYHSAAHWTNQSIYTKVKHFQIFRKSHLKWNDWTSGVNQNGK